MAVEQMVILDSAKLPKSSEMVSRARELGYPLELKYEFSTHTGFLPVKLDGVETGFESYVVPINQLGDLPGQLDAGLTHACVTRTGSDLREALAATIFLRTLTNLSGGPYWCPGDEPHDPSDAGPYLDEQIAQFRNLLATQEAKTSARSAISPESSTSTPAVPKRGFFSRLFGRSK